MDVLIDEKYVPPPTFWGFGSESYDLTYVTASYKLAHTTSIALAQAKSFPVHQDLSSAETPGSNHIWRD